MDCNAALLTVILWAFFWKNPRSTIRKTIITIPKTRNSNGSEEETSEWVTWAQGVKREAKVQKTMINKIF